MTFAWGTDDVEMRRQSRDVLAERIESAAIPTRYYNVDIHLGAFALPQYLLDILNDVRAD
jgi:spermidine synthase